MEHDFFSSPEQQGSKQSALQLFISTGFFWDEQHTFSQSGAHESFTLFVQHDFAHLASDFTDLTDSPFEF